MALVAQSQSLDEGQLWRLMRLTALLRDDVIALRTVLEIKESLSQGDTEGARGLFYTLEDHEQQAVWIAPKYGGIFTTEERKQLRGEG